MYEDPWELLRIVRMSCQVLMTVGSVGKCLGLLGNVDKYLDYWEAFGNYWAVLEV